MDKGTRRIDPRKRRSLPRNTSLTRRVGRCAQLVQKFHRSRSLHRTAVETPRTRETSRSGRQGGRIKSIRNPGTQEKELDRINSIKRTLGKGSRANRANPVEVFWFHGFQIQII